MKIISTFAFFVLSSHSNLVFAAPETLADVSFANINAERDSFSNKTIKIEGKIKDLKMIKEGGDKYATFFLADSASDATVSVKVDLTKKRTVINDFSCKDGSFTIVQGKFQSWGNASYLGKIEIKEKYEFKCSDSLTVRAVPPVVVAKKEEAIDTPKPTVIYSTAKVKSGSVLEIGTVVKTGSHSIVQLKYPDGSKLIIAPNSKLTTEAGTKKVQSVSLSFGRIHASVQKRTSEELHFKIKTKSATMGVRGTQFFVDSVASGKAITRVVEGRVDVAKDDRDLNLGKGVQVFKNEMVESDSHIISDKKSFDLASFLEKVKLEQPELLGMVEKELDQKIAVNPIQNVEPVAAPVVTQEVAVEKSMIAVFRLAGLTYLNKNSSAAFGGMISWNPETHLIGNWNLAANLGFGTKNSALEYGAAGIFVFNSSVAAELKIGAQSWLSGTKVTGAMGGLALRFGFSDECFINHLIIGDDILSINTKTYNIARVGLGFRF